MHSKQVRSKVLLLATIILIYLLSVACENPFKDDEAPSEVFITFPEDGATVNGLVTITVEATDNENITKIEFYIDGILDSTDTVSPWQYGWNTDEIKDNLFHTIFVIASDKENNSKSSEIISVQVALDSPVLNVTPLILDFGEADTLIHLEITNLGGGILEWSISDNLAWLTSSPTIGATEAETDMVLVVINRFKLTSGNYMGNIFVSSNGGTVDVLINMTVP